DGVNLRGAKELKPGVHHGIRAFSEHVVRAAQSEVVDRDALGRLLRLRRVGHGLLEPARVRFPSRPPSPERLSRTFLATSAGLPPPAARARTRSNPLAPVEPSPRS